MLLDDTLLPICVSSNEEHSEKVSVGISFTPLPILTVVMDEHF